MFRRSLLLSTIVLLAAPAFATIVYVSGSDSNLYTINPTNGATTLVGNMGVEMSDIAIDNALPVPTMYGVSLPPNGSTDSNLYSINMTTGLATLIGNTGSFVNALQFSSSGTLYGAGGVAGCGPPPADSTTCSTFFTVNTGTGHATAVNGTAGAYDSAGDLEFIGNTLYLTSVATSTTPGTNDSLYTINPATGVGTAVGSLGFQFVFGLAYVPASSTLYAFNDVGNNVLTVNPSTGAATSIGSYSGSFEITGAAELMPEPGTLGAMAFGLASLAGLAFRNRKRS